MLRSIRRHIAQSRTLAQNARDWLTLDENIVQAGRTPYDVIYEEDIVQLRYYPPLSQDIVIIDGRDVVVEKTPLPIPLVIVAPLAVNMFIYDLFPERSLVRYLRARGFEVYLVDWGTPTAHHNHQNLATYFADLLPDLLTRVRAHSGSEKLSLHGWSFGGLFSYCAAALGDSNIINLALVGAPNDYHANGQLGVYYQKLSRRLRSIEKRFGWRVHNSRKRFFRAPGWGNALSFKLTNPIGSLQGYTALLKNLHDSDYVSAHATNAAFLDRMVAYPGAVVQDFIQHLWVDNVLAHGKLPMRDCQSDLSSINANILAIVGRQDIIVNRDCAEALLDQVSSSDKTLIEVDGGHMGIVSGSRAPAQSWTHIADWLALRSGNTENAPATQTSAAKAGMQKIKNTLRRKNKTADAAIK
ncbi:MAG: alpha/beta fold hydrolase [Gammaproteobacteria bacterium]|nr:alpha/beta fold hydrolase [Gammaproteobacteria bacterium]MBQ0773362.1 alpha/beta fold hydrolase [Gammaproteobacteria bacterium]|tara:strand:+ start:65411 stop:66646 length:1236 start_codon:yes stop_codon:yes gene_type:complete